MFRESEINPFPAVSQYVHFLGVVGVNYRLNPYHSEQVCAQSQWFLIFLSKQPLAAELTAKAWFGRRVKNHLLPTRVVFTCFNQNDKLKTTMNISNRLVG